MIAKKLLFSTGLALSAVVGVSGTAQAASFTTFTNPANPDPTGDIFVTRIDQTIGDETRSLFPIPVVPGQSPLLRVNRSVIRANDAVTLPLPNTGNTGGASTDRGDNASSPLPPQEQLTPGNAADEAAVTAFLGNYNLNNIIDAEDTGSYIIDVFFEGTGFISSQFDNFLFYERGLNSTIVVQALGADGVTEIGNIVTIGPGQWSNAGFRIDTTEVPGPQEVGSFGISLADLGAAGQTVTGLRLQARGAIDNGPDFKVFAGNFIGETVPEPTTIIGLGSVAALALVSRRRKKSAV